tara:strand:- start:2084 stop:2389 length:306 start_codon:yes stop_codon:yes gene_type:complete
MLEATIVGAIGIITGLGALTNRVHGRINHVDRRLDSIELRIVDKYVTKEHLSEIDRRVDNLELRLAEQYVSKKDLSEIIAKVEAHMIRIESKLDRISLSQH